MWDGIAVDVPALTGPPSAIHLVDGPQRAWHQVAGAALARPAVAVTEWSGPGERKEINNHALNAINALEDKNSQKQHLVQIKEPSQNS